MPFSGGITYKMPHVLIGGKYRDISVHGRINSSLSTQKLDARCLFITKLIQSNHAFYRLLRVIVQDSLS